MTTVLVILLMIVLVAGAYGWVLFSREHKKHLETRIELAAMILDKQAESFAEEVPVVEPIERVIPEVTIEEVEVKEESEFALPPSIEPFKAVLWVIIGKEAQLKHGCKDILGDDWIRLRRIASRFKKLNPDLDTHEIFEAILICYREMEYVQAQRLLDVDQRESHANA